jgi:hypothetical protein
MRSIPFRQELWPSYERGRLAANGIIDVSCHVPILNGNCQAYHDMATHDVITGEGGLDASIQFGEEQQRSEVSQFSQL